MTLLGKHAAAGRDDPAKILIVEDEFLIAMECEWILTEAGHDVVAVAADEQQAVSFAERTRPDLVLMDIRLARGGDGITAAKAIRSRYGIGILFVSAHGERETRERGESADPVGWLVKPYTAGTLLEAIDKAIVRLDVPDS
ncbi:response regulator [Aurantimonas sp. A3-2-R12]|uniref:response regulator n=1 Tax=Aurantimonas sp. A3-2-R12 TaxID=3114362 RepID=UPI002E16ED4B|nr:response regulator [Aurantimonas sp. A3-2-R12]